MLLPCDRACARARTRPGENAPTHGQFFRNRCPGPKSTASSYSSFFPFSPSRSFSSCCLSHASYPRLRRVRRLFITRVPRAYVACKLQRIPPPIQSVFIYVARIEKKNAPSPSPVSSLSGIRGILTRTISHTRDVQKTNYASNSLKQLAGRHYG